MATVECLRRAAQLLGKHGMSSFSAAYAGFAHRLAQAMSKQETAAILQDVRRTFGGAGTITEVIFGRVHAQGEYEETPEQHRDFARLQQLLDAIYRACPNGHLRADET